MIASVTLNRACTKHRVLFRIIFLYLLVFVSQFQRQKFTCVVAFAVIGTPHHLYTQIECQSNDMHFGNGFIRPDFRRWNDGNKSSIEKVWKHHTHRDQQRIYNFIHLSRCCYVLGMIRRRTCRCTDNVCQGGERMRTVRSHVLERRTTYRFHHIFGEIKWYINGVWHMNLEGAEAEHARTEWSDEKKNWFFCWRRKIYLW